MLANQLKRIISLNNFELSGVEGNLLSAAKGKQTRTVCVTSCRRGEGKTVTAIAMAHALASTSGARVLLVDGNQRAPKVHQYFDVEASPGLTDLVAGRAQEADVLRETEYERLTLVPNGSGGEAGDGLKPEAFGGVLRSLTERFDYVVFDAD